MDSNFTDEFQIHKNRGNEYFKEQKFREAITEFSMCIEMNNNDYVIYSNRSGAYAQIQMYEDALKDANKCIELKSDWPKGYSRKGLALYNLGLLDEAESTYEKGLNLDPTSDVMKDGLRTVRENKVIFNSIKNNPKLQAYVSDPNYVKQLTELIKEMQKNPSSIKLLLNQPDVRLREGLLAVLGLGIPEEDEEEEKFRRRQEQEERERKKQEDEKRKRDANKTPEQIEAEQWKMKGNELYKKKQFDEALDAYNKAIEIFGNDLTYNNNVAAVYLEKGDYQKCIETCEKAIERRYEVKADYSVVAKIYARMGSCYLKMKDYAKAISMYEKSLLEDNNRHVRTALKEAERCKYKADEEAFINPEIAEEHRIKGNEFFKEGNYPEAKKEYDMAIKRNPKDAKLYSNRAAALMKLLEHPSALADIDKCLELDPKFVKGWIRKGHLHMALKEYYKADHAFFEGLKIQPDNEECRQGRIELMMKIQQSNRSEKVDQEQLKHAMADPEIQKILADPQFNLILKRITENPSTINEYMKDDKVADGIQKLLMAGILRLGQ